MLNKLLAMLPMIRGLSQQPIWTYQRVKEPNFEFDRAWIDLSELVLAKHGYTPSAAKRRVLLHSMGVNQKPFWHEHTQACAFLILGPGPYEVSFAPAEPLLPRRALARVLMQGVFGYELSGRDSWHAVRTYGPCHSIGLIGGDGDRCSDDPVAGPLPNATDAAALVREIFTGIDCAYDRTQVK